MKAECTFAKILASKKGTFYHHIERTNVNMDPAYECDAPTYIDFALLQQGKLEDDNADEWFGEF